MWPASWVVTSHTVRARFMVTAAKVFGCMSKRAQRKRHPQKDFEKLLQSAEGQGWAVVRRRRYYFAKCPEQCQCQLSVPLAPSAQRTLINKQAQFKRCSGWEGR